MKKAIIFRYGAYGDIIHMSWIPRALKESGYDIVDVETNFKGMQLLSENPYIDNLLGFDPSHHRNMPLSAFKNRIFHIGNGYDMAIDLTNSLEYGCIAMEDQAVYYMDDKTRRQFGSGNYYDISAIAAGLPDWVGRARGSVYFTDKEIEITEKIMLSDKYKDKFVVVVNLSGTGPHKILNTAHELIRKIIEELPNAYIITTGDNKKLDIKHTERSHSWIGRIPFREALLRIKYANCVIGCESGLMCGSNMWGTPTVQCMTAASVENHCKYAENDYSFQSPAKCSPCHRGPYNYYGCKFNGDSTICTDVPVETFMEKVRHIYEKWCK